MSVVAANNIHVFGIRHHGPGSARSLRAALLALQPDCILVEGPPDAEEVLPLLASPEMQPPVALLVYRPDVPRRAVYYPFATFSPEWQAISYGLSNGVPVRFMDLPQAYQLLDEPSVEDNEEAIRPAEPAPDAATPEQPAEPAPPSPREDPLYWLARAAGFGDGERWWEHMVEHRRGGADLFAAILEAMAALREAAPDAASTTEALREDRREAHMRQTIRAAQREGFARIAVVCGAWHAPVLAAPGPAKADSDLLKNLPKVKVQSTWVPWTYSRLSYNSGYGAGVESPGWYDYLWQAPGGTNIAIGWMARVARLLRDADLDASSAHVIEAVRLAEALAALRDRPAVGLSELNEATLSVMLFGDATPMHLIHERLIVGETLGNVPAATPMVPLLVDLQKEQRRLRLPAEAAARNLDLDLRNETDLQRSHLLHRLRLLSIAWGRADTNRSKHSTFHEIWQLQWAPEFAVALIEAGAWGNTVIDAASGRAIDRARATKSLADLTSLVDVALLADLDAALPAVMERLQEMAALSSDVGQLMAALPSLAGTLRYGNVRRTDATLVRHVLDGIVPRICVGLPNAVVSLNDEAAGQMYDYIVATHEALLLLQDDGYKAEWFATLARLADQQGLHGLLAGRATRLLLDAAQLDGAQGARRMGLALSQANEPTQAAAWIDGFLRGSGLLLLHDHALLEVLDGWLAALGGDAFTALLPLLRRTFGTFARPERRQIGEWARGEHHATSNKRGASSAEFDTARAEATLPLLAQLLGLTGRAG